MLLVVVVRAPPRELGVGVLRRRVRGEGHELMHPLNLGREGPRRGDVAKIQVGSNRIAIKLGAYTRQCKKGLGLGREGESMGALQDVERLHAEPVATDQQAAAAGIPEREIEHAVEAMHEGVTLCVVEMQQHL